MRYDNKVERIEIIHLLNFLGENNLEDVQKRSQKDRLLTNRCGMC
jgi:hypothetical protein